MKKSFLFFALALSLVGLVACKGQKGSDAQKESNVASTAPQTIEFDSIKTNAQLIKWMFKGGHVTKRDTIVEGNDTTIKIWYSVSNDAYVLISSDGDTTVRDRDWWGYVENGKATIIEEFPYFPIGDDDLEEFNPDEEPANLVVEIMPEFPGGTEAMLEYICKNQRFPEEARGKGIKGRVIVRFTVEKDGSRSDIEVIKPFTSSSEVADSMASLFDKEAIRLVKDMPKWKPGEQKGEKTRVKYTLPISFPPRNPFENK